MEDDIMDRRNPYSKVPYRGPERRAQPSGHTPFEVDTMSRFDHVETRLQEGNIYMQESSQRIDELRAEVTTLKASVDLNNSQTAEILEIVGMAKGFFAVLGKIGTFMKWFFGIAASIAAIWAAIKTGAPPPN